MDEPGSKPEQAPARDEHGRLLPGSTANRSGRSKGSRELAELVRKMITDEDGRNKVVDRLVQIALTGKPGAPTTVRAAEILLERGYGKAPITVEDAEGNGLPLGLVFLPMRDGDAG